MTSAAALDDPSEGRLAAWIETNLSCRITRFERQVPLLYRRVQRQCELFGPFLTRPSVANRIRTFTQLMASS